MKKILLCLAFCVITFSVYAQAFKASDPIGTTVFYEHINKKGGKIRGSDTSKMVLKAKTDTTDGVILSIGIYLSSRKDEAQSFLKVIYLNQDMHIDNNDILLSAMVIYSGEDPGMNPKINGDKVVYPPQIAVGDELPPYRYDATINIFGGTGTLKSVTTRRVIRQETMDLPIGTVEAYVIRETTHSDVETLGEKSQSVREMMTWFVPHLGVVKKTHYKNEKVGRGYRIAGIQYP